MLSCYGWQLPHRRLKHVAWAHDLDSVQSGTMIEAKNNFEKRWVSSIDQAVCWRELGWSRRSKQEVTHYIKFENHEIYCFWCLENGIHRPLMQNRWEFVLDLLELINLKWSCGMRRLTCPEPKPDLFQVISHGCYNGSHHSFTRLMRPVVRTHRGACWMLNAYL